MCVQGANDCLHKTDRVACHDPVALDNLRLRESMQMLVLDEADLLLSYGYDQDIGKIVSQVMSSEVCFYFHSSELFLWFRTPMTLARRLTECTGTKTTV